ncbi:TetR family transcriptional regulator [Amycolatopsis sp. MJM2582]|uniref:TetR family transcriptional regulator n=2 Tax=Amycolatopsis japonica group TaxID=2893673 RepID=A0A075VDE4_9PSEU|nr:MULTISPECIES: TetR family transcriptional regulator [Amycolatopsis]AIG80925.1 TetR family transcriptional regulator [Amycolatopsis japonica]KFZ83815.1 TetR family transcriptional regulator [Amycolatopsis sp. MJM2582]OKJ98210.1 TetR family transcriptional regulator [Amycolatopsis sp. CB00013]OLZ60188.1 TetR family transcriptional regulator [Amycolatopsis keratiniphila subsp. nogabecina]ONF74758.1 TetR family transcriptional regulator [Amycolatopsis keratiniphila subsp. keratiniphila]
MTAAATTPKGERRRAELIEAASSLLAEGGFDAVRHRAVAERAGLPLASTTYYFDSLEELVTAAVEHHAKVELEDGRQRLDELATRNRGVEATVDLVLDMLLGPLRPDREADAEAVLLRYERLVGTGRRPYLRPLMRTLSAQLYELLHEIFARSGTPVDATELERLVALVDGAVVNALIEVDPEPRAAAARMLQAALA